MKIQNNKNCIYSKQQVFFYYLIAFLGLFDIFVVEFILPFTLGHPTNKDVARWFTFFTNWTLMLMTVWSIIRIVSVYVKLPKWLISKNFDTIVVSAAIITCLVGNVYSMYAIKQFWDREWYVVLGTCFAHIFIPILTTLTYLLFAKNWKPIDEKKFIQYSAWNIDIFFIAWLIFTLIIFYSVGTKFPYPFLNPEKVGWWKETILCIVIVIGFFLVEMAFNQASNAIIERDKQRKAKINNIKDEVDNTIPTDLNN